MSGGWKPGDVAMVTHYASSAIRESIAVRELNGWRCAMNGALHLDGENIVTDARLLVVIDPENREQVQRVLDVLVEQWGVPNTASALAVVAAALRMPIKPDEPTGLGAVVKDAKGECWYRTADVSCGTSDEGPCAVWKRDNTNRLQETNVFSYRDIAAVKVLSEGVAQ